MKERGLRGKDEGDLRWSNKDVNKFQSLIEMKIKGKP